MFMNAPWRVWGKAETEAQLGEQGCRKLYSSRRHSRFCRGKPPGNGLFSSAFSPEALAAPSSLPVLSPHYTTPRNSLLYADTSALASPSTSAQRHPTDLAPSPRILEFLLQRGLYTRSLALVAVPQPVGMLRPLVEQHPMAAPPATVTTPADPWPRPYFFEGGLRRVAPYHFTYNTNCKMRWRGRELLDIFESEFRDRPVEYYKAAIESGMVVVNGKRASLNHIVKNGDIISHTLHRHEPPVTGSPIGIIHEDDDMIVISKPAGVPVHPAGRYNYNSVIEIMRSERGGAWNPLPCNRLDRLTSGVMFIGKHPKAAEELSNQISGRTVRKEYVARVKGEFPDGDVVCEMPILQISPKLGLNRVRANGKAARTVFKKLAYYPPAADHARDGIVSGAGDGDEGRPWMKKEGYSIVRCLPITGRTHQLRVHLQFLGHPITNDPIYCNQRVWGQDLGVGDADGQQSDEDVITRLARMGKEEVADAVAYHDEMVDEYNKRKAEKMSGELCEVCQTPLYTDPGVQELGIYLHSLRYEDKDMKWSYRSQLPQWALPPQGYEGPQDVGGLEEVVDLGKLEELEGVEDEVRGVEREVVARAAEERRMSKRQARKAAERDEARAQPVVLGPEVVLEERNETL